VTSCSPVDVRGLAGGTYCFHVQCRGVSQAEQPEEAGSKQYSVLLLPVAGFTYASALKMAEYVA
jgi:hypothetical protein